MLACGCDFGPGSPINEDQLKEHHRHTTEAMIMWDILMDANGQRSTIELMSARIAYAEELDKAFPEAVPHD